MSMQSPHWRKIVQGHAGPPPIQQVGEVPRLDRNPSFKAGGEALQKLDIGFVIGADVEPNQIESPGQHGFHTVQVGFHFRHRTHAEDGG